MRVSKQRFPPFPYLVALLMACFCLSNTQASTILQMSFGEVVDSSELVFEGQVASLESRRIDDGNIYTFVTFQISEIVKGEFENDTIELRFLGGQVGTRGLQVSDMQMPEIGERGIYFVESLLRFQVNPLVGWAQGHYLIADLGNGDNVVTTANRDPIVSVEAADKVPATLPQTSFSKGLAKGVSVRQGLVSNASSGISAAQFKASIREMADPAR